MHWQRFGTAEEDAYRRDLTINRFEQLQTLLLFSAPYTSCIAGLYLKCQTNCSFLSTCFCSQHSLTLSYWETIEISFLHQWAPHTNLSMKIGSLFYNITNDTVEDFTGRGNANSVVYHSFPEYVVVYFSYLFFFILNVLFQALNI